MEGYDRLTPQMAEHSELSIFRKFSILNYRMLLYMQSQLGADELRLINAIKADQASGHVERTQFVYDFQAMLNPQDNDSEGVKVQRKIMDETFPVLKNYSE